MGSKKKEYLYGWDDTDFVTQNDDVIRLRRTGDDATLSIEERSTRDIGAATLRIDEAIQLRDALSGFIQEHQNE